MAKPKPAEPKIKKSVDFTKSQIKWLRLEAFKRETSFGGALRQILDEKREA